MAESYMKHSFQTAYMGWALFWASDIPIMRLMAVIIVYALSIIDIGGRFFGRAGA